MGPHRVLSRKGLWYGGSLGSPHLVGLGDYAGAGGGGRPELWELPRGCSPTKAAVSGRPHVKQALAKRCSCRCLHDDNMEEEGSISVYLWFSAYLEEVVWMDDDFSILYGL